MEKMTGDGGIGIAVPRAIRPDDLTLMRNIPGIIGVARDEELRLFWCTTSYLRVSSFVTTFEEARGTRLADTLTPGAAAERERMLRRVIETGEVLSHYLFSADSRVLCTIFPLDPDAFGHAGVLALIKDAPFDARLGIDREIPLLSTPDLYQLNALSARELEVLYFVALGLSTSEIASELVRSPKTIENHINSIHRKLGTHSRSELVRLLSERGVQSFTREEWDEIVEGASRVRKEQRDQRNNEDPGAAWN